MNKNKKTKLDYEKLTQREHVLKRPDTYVGSVEEHKDKNWVVEGEKLEFRELTYVPALLKIFDEVIVNAWDNLYNSQTKKIPMSQIAVELNEEQGWVSVQNDGAFIPVEVHPIEKIYNQTLIFGNLLTSSRYDDDEQKFTGGRNGFGAKLTNIYSRRFEVYCVDPQNKLEFRQVFKNNMKDAEEPVVKKTNAKKGLTKITFHPDFSRFKMNGFDKDMVGLIIKRVYDMAGITNATLNVSLNGKTIKIKDFEHYIKMFLKEDDPFVYTKLNDNWEFGIATNETNNFQSISYVNSVFTAKGGTHVNHLTDLVVNGVLDELKKKKFNQLNKNQVKQHLIIFANCKIANPTFDTQTKETMTRRLTAEDTNFKLNPKVIKDFTKNTDILDRCIKFAKAREDLMLNKALNAGSRKAERLKIDKLDDANQAGKRESEKCTLILTEGDSAKSFAMDGLSVVGRDYYGVFPLRGKLLNVRDASNSKIADNEEIQNLFKIIGLEKNKLYDTVRGLRYGSVMIMTDQDHDGSHIKGLIVNFFDKFWPKLLKINGFLKQFITPIIKARKGNECLNFFSIPQFEEWASRNESSLRNYKIKYYKGLGTSDKKESKEYFNQLDTHEKRFVLASEEEYDDIDKVFRKTRADDRKNWLSGYNEQDQIEFDKVDEVSYREFIDKELIHFSVHDNMRSIPHIMDGMKPTERKVLYGAFKKNIKSEIKVIQLCGYIMEHTKYHHGDASLNETIVAMAQNFVGSNNINLLNPNGQFGSRAMGGKDHASARYISTSLNTLARTIFIKEDDALLDNIIEEGYKIEPKFYVPIIPMILVNGAEGIGTGWSTKIPCYNPIDLVNSIMFKLETGTFLKVLPHFKGYKGTIEAIDATRFKTEGAYELDYDQQMVKITELPIRCWTDTMKKTIQDMMGLEASTAKEKERAKDKKKAKKEKNPGKQEKKEQIKPASTVDDLEEHHTINEVDFRVFLPQEEFDKCASNPNYVKKKFNLVSTFSLTNMVLFNCQGRLRRYDTVEEIMEEFYSLRLHFYKERKTSMLDAIERKILLIDNKIRFILEYIEDKIQIKKVKKDRILEQLVSRKFTKKSEMQGNNFKNAEEKIAAENEEEGEEVTGLAKEYDYLLSMPIWSLTFERIEAMEADKNDLVAEREKLKGLNEKDLWRIDLNNFLEEHKQMLIKEEKEIEKENMDNAKYQAKQKKRKPKKPKKTVTTEKKKEQTKIESFNIPLRDRVKQQGNKANTANIFDDLSYLGGNDFGGF